MKDRKVVKIKRRRGRKPKRMPAGEMPPEMREAFVVLAAEIFALRMRLVHILRGAGVDVGDSDDAVEATQNLVERLKGMVNSGNA